MLARYFINANIGWDQVSSVTEEADSFRNIQQVYKENNFNLRWLKCKRHLKISPQRNQVDETSRCHGSLRMWLREQQHRQPTLFTTIVQIRANCPPRGKWVHGHLSLWREIDEMQKIYRPMTFITAFDKIFEQLLSHQVICHYDKTLYSKMKTYRKKLAWTDRRWETGRRHKTTFVCFVYWNE